MPVLEAKTVVHRPPAVVFDALLDLRRYEAYSDHLAAVERQGDGGVDTEYTLQFEWWLVTYTVRSRVTRVERPNRLDFVVTEGIAAEGSWQVEAIPNSHAPADTDAHPEPAVEVTFVVDYDPDTVTGSALRLPAVVSLDWIVDRVAPLVEREVQAVVEQVVRDLEGSRRDVDLEVRVR